MDLNRSYDEEDEETCKKLERPSLKSASSTVAHRQVRSVLRFQTPVDPPNKNTDSQFLGKPKMLKFVADTDDEEEASHANMEMTSDSKTSPFHGKMYLPSFHHNHHTPSSHSHTSSQLWDSGLGSPTPGASPRNNVASSGGNHHHHRRGLAISPIPVIHYDSELDEGESWNKAEVPAADTPPHRSLKSLRLYDNPQTPKSLLQQSQRRNVRTSQRMRQSTDELLMSGAVAIPYDPELSVGMIEHQDCSLLKYVKVLDPTGPQTNVNPFALMSAARVNAKRSSAKRYREGEDSLMEDDCDEARMPPCKRLALREINTSRYMEEFHQISKIGSGEFGSVYDCVNRLDGCHYAIKKSRAPVAESIFERIALNEVYAHAVLGKHLHVVRYFSAWAEDGHMYIQNEFCNGGSLANKIADYRQRDQMFAEYELIEIMIQTARGLKYIHSEHLVHLDIKPANIFIDTHSRTATTVTVDPDDEDLDNFDTAAGQLSAVKNIYKIGDLGHVTSVNAPLVEEGDCRYLPVEILQERYEHLAKADIFSLALTIYEAASLAELPKNGPDWHELREYGLPSLPHLSSGFNQLLKLMASFDPKSRPSSSDLVHHPILVPVHLRTRAELCHELRVEKLKNEMLIKELVEVRQAINPRAFHPSIGRGARILGRKCARSASMTVF